MQQIGTVKFFNDAKGFGFIKPDDSDQELFVHVTSCIDHIKQNDKVKYQVERGLKGYTAIKVEVL